MDLHIPGWILPLTITAASYFYALVVHKDEGGYFSGLGNLLMLVPASIISAIAWMIYAFMC